MNGCNEANEFSKGTFSHVPLSIYPTENRELVTAAATQEKACLLIYKRQLTPGSLARHKECQP